ncbi:MAG: hypothetical protein J1F39_03535 [Clostridiales bacterium]|nr:hypothetical protein [Clostridiales bacterium]
MICPQCGYDMGTRHRCLRCGFEITSLVTVDEEERKRRERDNAKVIDPSATYLTDEYGYAVDEDEEAYAGPFGSLLEDLFGFDPFAGLLGGFFGMGSMGGRPKRKEVFIDRIHDPGEDDGKPKIVDINNVEVVDDDDDD